MPHLASSRILASLAFLATLAGVIDPLEGSLIILAGVIALAAAGRRARSPHRPLLYWALGLTTIGVMSMWLLSAAGGFGGTTGRSTWWAALLAPYAVGWVLAIVGGWRLLRGIFSRGGNAPAHA